MANEEKCKYCGAKASKFDMCGNCSAKLPLVRKMLALARKIGRAAGRDC